MIKRCTRHDKPTGKGRQDIEKAIHELQLLLELRYPVADESRGFLGKKIAQLVPGRVPAGFTEYKPGQEIPPPKTICDVLFTNGDLVCGLEIGHFPLFETAAYRVHRNHPAWPDDKAYRWMAQDADGEWFAYLREPEIGPMATGWVSPWPSLRFPKWKHRQANTNWRDTLIERGADE